MDEVFSDTELLAFLEEQLSAERSSKLETILRHDEAMRSRLLDVRGRNQAGLHTIGEIWRQGGLSCPAREEWQEFLNGKSPSTRADYLRFHLRDLGCRTCQANLDDLTTQQIGGAGLKARRSKFFQTSAGHLGKISGN